MVHSPKVVRKWESIPFLVWLAIVVAAIIVFLWLRFRTVEVPFDRDETVIEKTEISPSQAPQRVIRPTPTPQPQQSAPVNQSTTVINEQPEPPESEPTPNQEPGLIEGVLDTVKELL